MPGDKRYEQLWGVVFNTDTTLLDENPELKNAIDACQELWNLLKNSNNDLSKIQGSQSCQLATIFKEALYFINGIDAVPTLQHKTQKFYQQLTTNYYRPPARIDLNQLVLWKERAAEIPSVLNESNMIGFIWLSSGFIAMFFLLNYFSLYDLLKPENMAIISNHHFSLWFLCAFMAGFNRFWFPLLLSLSQAIDRCQLRGRSPLRQIQATYRGDYSCLLGRNSTAKYYLRYEEIPVEINLFLDNLNRAIAHCSRDGEVNPFILIIVIRTILDSMRPFRLNHDIGFLASIEACILSKAELPLELIYVMPTMKPCLLSRITQHPQARALSLEDIKNLQIAFDNLHENIREKYNIALSAQQWDSLEFQV